MSVYPEDLDDDTTIIRVNDNISEIGGDAINQLRDAVFAIEKEIGLTPAGSKGSLSERLNVSIDADGTIKASALTSVGLVTLPIDNAQVGANAGIEESKLDLDYSTSDLNTLIQANSTLLNSLSGFFITLDTKVNSHIGGSSDPTLRHVASHIDLNDVPSDIRDVSYNWSGLKDKDGTALTATTVAEALDQINTNLVGHQNQTEDAHDASAISVDTSEFLELSQDSENLQEVINNIDEFEVLRLGTHRATQHSNGIPKDARAISLINPDGYSHTVVGPTPIVAHVAHNPPGTVPVDSVTTGDNVIYFQPTNTNSTFDAKFSQVKVGDIIRINYGNGIEDIRKIDSTRFTPGIEWVVRVNGVNLRDTDGYEAYARIDRPLYDPITHGVLAVAAANPTPLNLFSNILGSVIIGDPRGAVAVGIGFNANHLDEDHYNLYLELYPTGNPEDHVISLPAIDVTGNAGVTPGKYTLDSVVQEVNNKFREIGYNYRFIAFAVEGNFGLMLADSINAASFAIISGSNSSGSLIEGIYTNNVIGNATSEIWDALGLGANRANLASPAYQNTWVDSTAALLPTKVIHPAKRKNYVVNGKSFDSFKKKPKTTDEGYWLGEIVARTVTAATVEVTYQVNECLDTAGLKAGKTIVIQPAIEYSSPSYFDADYGRFVIKEVTFSTCENEQTLITVISGIHAFGSGVGFSSDPGLEVKLYFSEDSVSFDRDNLIDGFPSGNDYHKYFEIYITEQRTTFSHQRARLPYQAENINKLGTENWHISSVSPKLRGYRDTGSTDFNKYLRFYVTRYDSTSGEYDGYIGKRASVNDIEKTGPLITGRKNVITRFYDETNVDYIDLEYVELATTSPGNNILSTTTPRYVDIELFPSLVEDDELLLLASCEVNWEPASGQNIIERVVDRRHRGSISEKEFTESAVNFITAGDRHLHQNGVVRGLDFVQVGSVTPGELFFTGGVVLVNGKILTLNNGSVTIPQVTKETAPPQTLDWAVCVNDKGNLVALPLTDTKTQFYARNAVTVGTYYIPSVTFSELIYDRKDLTLIAIATATISSISVSVKDARKYVENESLHIPFTWVPNRSNNKDTIGHFRTIESLKSWINKFGAENNTVTVKGSHSITSVVDLTDLTNAVTFKGENAIFNISSGTGFSLGSNITFKDISFVYNPTGLTYDTGNIVNTGNGCLFGEANDSLTNIVIENCQFSCTQNSSQRPPFINFQLDDSQYIDNVTISHCTFDDETAENNCAIAFINTLEGSITTFAPTIGNVFIKENICNQLQSIFLTSQRSGTGRPGLHTVNVNVLNNNTGTIAYCVASSNTINTNVSGYMGAQSLNITGNTTLAIMSPVNAVGKFDTTGNPDHSSSNVIISNNSCSFIRVFVSDKTSHNEYGSVSITGNHVRANDYTTLVQNVFDSGNFEAGIAVLGPESSVTNAVISNNIIEQQFVDGYTHVYDSGIIVSSSAVITNNIISGLASNNVGIGIYLAGSESTTSYLVKGNSISRGSNNIFAYIAGTTSKTAAMIVDNVFDSPFISGSTTTVIRPVLDDGINWVAERNKNQTVEADLLMVGGFLLINGIAAGPTGTSSYIDRNSYVPTFRYDAGDAGDTVTFIWGLPLNSVLPNEVKIISVSMGGTLTGNLFNTTGDFYMLLETEPTLGAAEVQSNTVDFTADPSGTLTISTSDHKIAGNGIASLAVVLIADGDANNRSVKVTSPKLTYRW